MPTLKEKDLLRIRQFIQRLESGLIEGQQVFVTYHDSNLAATPSNPTGDGTTGGWHRLPTEASNWMSVKTALTDAVGTWGTPIRVFGLQGTETAGVGLSADIPKLEQITFIGDGSSKVGWTAGTVEYGGNSYAIAVKAVGDGSTNAYIYWDDADGQTSFKTTATFATAIAAHHWVVCINDSGKAIPATSARILHGGLIQAGTITAAKIATYNLTAANATIENLMVKTAHIENLNVSTGKIANSATKILETTVSDGWSNPAATTWETVITDTIVSLGNAIQILVEAEVHATTDGDTEAYPQVRLTRDGGEIKLWSHGLISYPSDPWAFSGSDLDVPGSGLTTYALQINRLVSGAPNDSNVRAKLNLMVLTEDLGK